MYWKVIKNVHCTTTFHATCKFTEQLQRMHENATKTVATIATTKAKTNYSVLNGTQNQQISRIQMYNTNYNVQTVTKSKRIILM